MFDSEFRCGAGFGSRLDWPELQIGDVLKVTKDNIILDDGQTVQLSTTNVVVEISGFSALLNNCEPISACMIEQRNWTIEVIGHVSDFSMTIEVITHLAETSR